MVKGIVGVLALQGDFKEHLEMLNKLGVQTLEVRFPEQLNQIDRLIIPGGESTTIGLLMDRYVLTDAIIRKVLKGMPVWGTCAGAILLSKTIVDGKIGQRSLGLIDITARRNAYGRQLESFEAEVKMPEVDQRPFEIVFIRAPKLENLGKEVKILGKLKNGTIIAAKQGNILATCFHPELTTDTRFHKYFLKI